VFLNYPCIPSLSISPDNREYTVVPTILVESPKGPSDEKCLGPTNPLIRPCSEGIIPHTVVTVHVDVVRSCFWTSAAIGPIVHPSNDIWDWSHGGMILTGKNRRTGEKPVPVRFCPPKISHRPTWAQTGASAVRSRRLTAWAMARLLHVILTQKLVIASFPKLTAIQ
jgi:hypothetical protein